MLSDSCIPVFSPAVNLTFLGDSFKNDYFALQVNTYPTCQSQKLSDILVQEVESRNWCGSIRIGTTYCFSHIFAPYVLPVPWSPSRSCSPDLLPSAGSDYYFAYSGYLVCRSFDDPNSMRNRLFVQLTRSSLHPFCDSFTFTCGDIRRSGNCV